MDVESAHGAARGHEKPDFFTTPELTQRLDLIQHLIENTEVIPLVRGPAGAGKSSFAASIPQLAPADWSLCLFEAETDMLPDRLLARLARCFGSSGDAGKMLEGLVSCFESLRLEGKLPVLLIDDAQRLAPSSLIMLLRLFERQYEGAPLLSIVLFADEQINMLLTSPQIQLMTPQVLQIIDLPSWSREDVTHFMRFLLRMERLPPDMEIDDTKLSKLYRESKGIPGPLRQAILSSVGETKRLPSLSFSARAQWILVGFLGFSLIVVSLLFQRQINALFEPSSSESKARPTLDVNKRSATTAEPTLSPRFPEHEVDAPSRVSKPVASVMQNRHEAVSSPVPSDGGKATPSGLAATERETQEAPVQRAQAQSDEISPVVDREMSEQSPVAQREVEIPELTATDEDESAPLTEAAPEPQVKSEPIPAQTTLRADDDQTDEVEAASRQPASTDPLERKAWILRRPANHYTLQLLGVKNLESLKSFVERYDLHREAFYFTTTRKGKPWHPLLWGDFPDKKSAKEASERLPVGVQKSGFWIRSYASVHAQIDD